jgi:hypothetical protein
MSYTKYNFIDGEVLDAEKLNSALQLLPSQLKQEDFGKQLFVNDTGDGFL